MVRLSEIAAGVGETEPLYWSNSYLKTFDATILRTHREGGRNIYVVLDRTAFHPKGGGQPADTGTLQGDDFTIRVRKVMQIRGVIIHWGKILEGVPDTGKITGVIDWKPRYLYMRRHTAGHLLDHCLSVSVGHHVRTTDSWLGDPCYVGYEGEIPSDEALCRTRELENQMIEAGGEVRIEIVSRNELLKRAPEAPNIYRLPQLEQYRIVTIEGCDPIPCGGCHLKDIAEIGSFKISRVAPSEKGFNIYYEVAPREM